MLVLCTAQPSEGPHSQHAIIPVNSLLRKCQIQSTLKKKKKRQMMFMYYSSQAGQLGNPTCIQLCKSIPFICYTDTTARLSPPPACTQLRSELSLNLFGFSAALTSEVKGYYSSAAHP